MANQIIPDKIAEKQYSLNSLLEIGLFFKDPKNRELIYKDNWTFEKIESALLLWIGTFNPELKNASFEEILAVLSQLTAEELTQTTVPAPLLEQLEKELDQTTEINEEIKQKAADFKNEFIERLKKSIIPSEKKAVIAEGLSQNLSEKLDKSDLPVLLLKSEENLFLKEQIQQDFLEIWKEAVAETAKINNLSAEEVTFLNSLSSPVLQIIKPIENRTQINQYQKQIDDGEQKEVLYYQEKIENLKKQQAENITKVLSSPFSPEKAKLFSDSFFEFLPDNLARYNTEEATLATLWQMVGGEVVLKPEEVAVVFNNLTLTGTSLPKNTLNVLHLKDENGVSVFDQVKQQLLSGGINTSPENDKKLKTLRFQVRAIESIYKGLKKEDLQAKINQLLKSGLPETSPEITELKGVSTAYEEIIQKARESGFPEKQIIRWQKQALSLGGKIRLPFSSKIKSWFLNTSLGKPIKLAMEKSAQKALQALWTAGQEGIKKIAIPVFTKILTALGFGAKAALVGATNIVGLALLVVPKLIGKTKDLVKSIFSFGTGLFHSILSGITGTTDIPEDSDSKWLKKIFFGTFVFLLFFSGAIDKDIKNGAFIEEKGGDLSFEEILVSVVPPECQNPKHLSEETICKLSKGADPCNQERVNQITWNKVDSCFNQIQLQGKEIIRSNFEFSKEAFKSLQCVGFVKGIQAALGNPIDTTGNARDYLSSIPTGYTKIEGTSLEIKRGDIAIWKGSEYGHMGVVVEIIEPPEKIDSEIILGKLVVAQAWGTENTSGGAINLSAYNYGNPSAIGAHCPDGYLRKK